MKEVKINSKVLENGICRALYTVTSEGISQDKFTEFTPVTNTTELDNEALANAKSIEGIE